MQLSILTETLLNKKHYEISQYETFWISTPRMCPMKNVMFSLPGADAGEFGCFFFQNRYHPSLSPITPKSKYERQKHSTSKKGGVAANITSKTTTLVKRCMHTYMYIVSSIKMFVSRDVYTNCYMCLWC